MNTIVLFCVLLAPLAFADPSPSPRGLPRGGCFNIAIGIPAIWLSSAMVSAPIGFVLADPSYEDIKRQPAILATLLLAWLGAWCIVRIFSSFGERRRVIALRTTAMLMAVFAAERLAFDLGVPVMKHGSNILMIGFIVTITCVGCWRLRDRAYFPLRLVALAAGLGSSVIVVGGSQGLFANG